MYFTFAKICFFKFQAYESVVKVYTNYVCFRAVKVYPQAVTLVTLAGHGVVVK
jgi:hypothetical protein